VFCVLALCVSMALAWCSHGGSRVSSVTVCCGRFIGVSLCCSFEMAYLVIGPVGLVGLVGVSRRI
jgi:hypothetical protein